MQLTACGIALVPKIMLSSLWLTLVISLGATVCAKKPPHIVMILADDVGWANVDWHRPSDFAEKATPHMSELVQQGIALERHYAFKFCSPSRTAIQSGRSAIMVNVQNLDPIMRNTTHPETGYQGIPKSMTGMGEVMRQAGYQTHFVGKWDAGMATPAHTPHGRGYDTSLLYFHHDNDYWTSYVNPSDDVQGTDTCPGQGLLTDLWDGKNPAIGQNNSAECYVSSPGFPAVALRTLENSPSYPGEGSSTEVPKEGCLYEDLLFNQRAMQIVDSVTPETDKPLFLFWAPHVNHGPLQVPKEWLDRYSHIDDWRRQRYLAMTSFLDDSVANMTAMLKAKRLYNHTLIVFSSDNGGPIYARGDCGANNHPLRGGKASNWEGGIRVAAFVSGGAVPITMRGKRLEGLSCVWDWYSTFAAVGGVDSYDAKAEAKGLPPVDSVNLWPYLTGATSFSPRKDIPLGSSSCIDQTQGESCTNFWGEGTHTKTIVDGLIRDEGGNKGLWKLILGKQPETGWQGPVFPNSSTYSWNSSASVFDCGTKRGCLFHLSTDPNEENDVSLEHPTRAATMLAEICRVNQTAFSPHRGTVDIQGACAAAKRYGGFWGPWLDTDTWTEKDREEL